MLQIQDLEVPTGRMKQGYLKISQKPSGTHQIPMTILNGTGNGPTLLINGGIHGSEYHGPAATLRLMVEIDPKKLNGVLIIVPMVNTLAFDARWYQTNPVDYRNLSQIPIVQVIPRGGSGHPLISYRIAQIFYQEIVSKADFQIDLHSGDLFLDLTDLTFYRKMESDPHKDRAAFALARNFGWSQIREKRPSPNSNKQAEEDLVKPITMGTEAGGMGRCQSDIVDRVFQGFLNVLKHLEMIEGTPKIPPEATLFNTYHVHANHGGLFISNIRAGDMVSKGDVIGVIKNLFGVVLEEIITPTDGLVVMVTSPAIYEDDAVFEIGYNLRTI